MDAMEQQIVGQIAREAQEANESIANLVIWAQGVNSRLNVCEQAILLLGDEIRVLKGQPPQGETSKEISEYTGPSI